MAQPVNFNFLERTQTAGSSPRITPPQPSRIPELTERLNYFKARCEAQLAGYAGSGNYETPLPPPECDAAKLIERQIEEEQKRLDNYQASGMASTSPLSSKSEGLRAPVEQRLGIEKLDVADFFALPLTIPAALATTAISATAAIGLTAVGTGLAIGDAVFSEIGNAISPPPPPQKIEVTWQGAVNFVASMKTENPPPRIQLTKAQQEAILLSAKISRPPRQSYTDFSQTQLSQEE